MGKQNYSKNSMSRPGRHQQSDIARTEQRKNQLQTRQSEQSQQRTGAEGSKSSPMQAIETTVGEKLGSEMQSAKNTLSKVGEQMSGIMQTTGSTLSSVGRSVVDTVKANPIPIALAGVGLSWLAINALSSSKSGSASRQRSDGGSTSSTGSSSSSSGGVKSKLQSVGSEASKLLSGAQSSIGQATRSAGSSIEHVAQDALQRGRKLETSIEELIKENPMLAGAAMFAAGAAVGLAIPRSSGENAWFGHSRDEIVHKAQALAHDAYDKVESVVQAVKGNGRSSTSNAHA